MKKFFIWAFAGLLLVTACKKKEAEESEPQRHFSVLDEQGNPVDEGREFVFHTYGDEAVLKLRIKNNSQQDIYVKTKLTAVSGISQSQLEVCIANSCYPVMLPDLEYPHGQGFRIGAGQTTAPDELHYTNYSSEACSYKLEILEEDADGNKIGEPFTFTYTYRP